MSTYKYIDKTGVAKTIDSDTPENAIKNAKDIASDSGVQLINTPATTTPVTTPVTDPTATKTPVVDPNANQTTPSVTIPRTIYGEEPSAITAKSVEEIQAEKQKAAQAEIDNLNKYYATLRSEQEVVNAKNDRSTNAISALTGLSGSTEADVAAKTTTEGNTKALAKIEQERLVAVNAVLSDIRTSAVEEARQQRLEARQSEQDRIAYREKTQAEATKNLTSLSKATPGLTLEGLKKTLSPTEYQHIIDNVGGEALAKAIIFENRSKDSVLGTPQLIGGKMVQAYQTSDGKVKYEQIDLPEGVNPGNIKSIEKTDNGIFIINNDGTYTRVAGSAKPAEGGTTTPGENPQLYSGLSTKTATAVRAKTAAYKTEPTVQNFAVIQEGRNFAGSLSNTTTNPVDDQGLIYALAKALDPGSVVREGEYATAQKYAQSWISAFGKGVTQALLGTGFLSETARKQIKDTIEAKYKASKTSYDNIQKQYETGINNLTGRSDGAKFLSDYSINNSSNGGTSDPLGLFQ